MPAIRRETLKVKAAVLIVVYLVPVLVFYAAYSYYWANKLEIEKNCLFNRISHLAKKLEIYGQNDHYWGRELKHIFEESTCVGSFTDKLSCLSQEKKQVLAWAVVDGKNKIRLSQNLQKYAARDWSGVMKIFQARFRDRIDADDNVAEYRLRRFFGPHLRLGKFSQYIRHLISTDFLAINPLLWCFHNEKFTALVLFPPALLKKSHGLQDFIREYEKLTDENEYAYVEAGDKVFVTANFRGRIADNSLSIFNLGKVIQLHDKLVFSERIKPDLHIVHVSAGYPILSTKIIALFAMFYLLICLILLKTYNFFQLTRNWSIRRFVIIFIGVANILPIVILLFFARQLLEQKRLVLIDQKRIESINFIQKLEREFQNDIERFPGRVEEKENELLNELQKKSLHLEPAREFSDWMHRNEINFYFIASSTFPSFSYGGYLEKNLFKSFDREKSKSFRESKRILEIAAKIGSCYLSFWNGTPVPQKVLTEVELVSDIAFQKPIDESLHMLVELSDRIGYFGFGKDSEPSVARVRFAHSDDKADFIGIYQYRSVKNARMFLDRQKGNRLSNIHGLKVIFAKGRPLEPETLFPLQNIENLENTFFTLSDFPPINSQIMHLDGNGWIFTGFKSSILTHHYVVALYPLGEIDARIKGEKRQIAVLIIISVLVVAGIALFLSYMLVAPVTSLEAGAKAMKNREFSFRLPDLGNDEFGYMARVLNESLRDIEELSAARVVQQQLFPKQKPDTGVFDLFGNCISLVDLGGDYLDYFAVNKNNFSVLIGDVAGHGVGAALIMAMVKSAILLSEDLFTRPALLAARLHQMIYAAKTKKQKKIMTFQYLYVDSLTGKIKLTNAGGCSPFLVKIENGNVEEIKIPGAALGAFKHNRFIEIELQLEPGDAIVLYTDGIVEARNQSGEEVGFAGLKEILRKCRSDNAENFFNSIIGEYQKWLAGMQAGDDLTLAILTRPVKILADQARD